MSQYFNTCLKNTSYGRKHYRFAWMENHIQMATWKSDNTRLAADPT